jgi:hypothetical protein
MTKNLVTALVISAALAACGGKTKKATTPDNTGSQTEMKAGSTGGATYGGTAKSTAPAGNGSASGAGADPCGSP